MTRHRLHPHLLGRPTGRRRAFGAAVALVAVLALSGCGSVRDAVGIERDAPDEFQVTVRAPLSMPADFGLRAPRPGSAEAAQDDKLRDRTRQIVLDATGDSAGKKAKSAEIKGVTPAEAALLRKVGGEDVDPNIRQVVERETSALELEAKGFVDDLLFWKDKQPAAKVVDPAAERRRIQGNAALGRSATSGPTPEISRKKSGGLLQGLF